MDAREAFTRALDISGRFSRPFGGALGLAVLLAVPTVLVLVALWAGKVAFGFDISEQPVGVSVAELLASAAVLLAIPALLCLGICGLLGRAPWVLRLGVVLVAMLVVAIGAPGGEVAPAGAILALQLPVLLGAAPVLFPTPRGGWPSRVVAVAFGGAAAFCVGVIIVGLFEALPHLEASFLDMTALVGVGGFFVWLAVWAAYAAGAWWIDSEGPRRPPRRDRRDATSCTREASSTRTIAQRGGSLVAGPARRIARRSAQDERLATPLGCS